MSSMRFAGSAFVLVLSLALPAETWAGAYVFAGEANGVDLITHPQGYLGGGGSLTIEVCIDPTSAIPPGASSLSDLETSVLNNIEVWNEQAAGVGNADRGSSNGVPSGSFDFESVALHELGHCLGLAHVNAASESGLGGADLNYTRATDGADNAFGTDAGLDGVRGTLDDIRGDDVNLHWFRTDTNDPGALPLPPVIDSTTYARSVVSLPPGHLFAQNLDRDAADEMGHPSAFPIETEAIMQQGAFTGEAQRELTADGVATLRYAMSGLDETQGTADDYAILLTYGGISSAPSCALSMAFTGTSSLAFCSVGGSFVSPDHVRVTTATMEYGAGFNWYFNPLPRGLGECPESPVAGCAASGANKSLLLLRDNPLDFKDTLKWKWVAGPVVDPSDWGDPVSGSTAYNFCVWDESGGGASTELVVDTLIPPGGTCNGKPCWKAFKDGFKFKDPGLDFDGIKTITLKGNALVSGKAKIIVVGKGLNLPFEASGALLPLEQDSTTTAQLISSEGNCWEAGYSGNVKNEVGIFKAKGG